MGGICITIKLQTAAKNSLTILKGLDQRNESFYVPICRWGSGNQSRSHCQPAQASSQGVSAMIKAGAPSARRASDLRGGIRTDAYYYVPGPSFLDIPEILVGGRRPCGGFITALQV